MDSALFPSFNFLPEIPVLRFIIISFPIYLQNTYQTKKEHIRDTYSSYSIACGVDVAKVQDRLGHESLKETDRYAKAINEPIADDIRKVFIGDKEELMEN